MKRAALGTCFAVRNSLIRLEGTDDCFYRHRLRRVRCGRDCSVSRGAVLRDRAGPVTQFLDAALAYQRAGFHVIPVEPKGKRPILASWREYVERQPTEAEVRAWWATTPDANVALLMGRGVFALDIDGPEGEAALVAAGIELPDNAPQAATSKGRHVFMTGVAPNSVGVLPKVDTRSDGGYVVVAPSVHPSGVVYAWVSGRILTDGIPPAPPALLELLARPTKPAAAQAAAGVTSADWVSAALSGVGEGSRDATCARLAGYFWGLGATEAVVEILCQDFGARCEPPFPPDQVSKTVASIVRREGGPQAPAEEDELDGGAAIVQFIDRLLKPEKPRRVVSTGLKNLDKALNGGLYPGQATYWAGVGGVGKSITAQMLAIRSAMAGDSVFYATLEMPPADCLVRLLSYFTFIDSRKILAWLHGQEPLEEDDARRFRGLAPIVGELPLTFRQNCQTVEAIDRALAKRPETKLLVVDQIHHLRHPDGANGIHGLEANSRALVELAGKHDIPVVGVCQVNRPEGKDRNPNWRPTRYSLRGSEQLFHDPAVVLLFHRSPDTPERLEIQVAKGRMGGASEAWLSFKYRPETCRVGED